MNIVITGASGFIGCHLVKRFINSGHDIIGIDLIEPNYKSSSEIFKNKKFTFLKFDVKNTKKLKATLNDSDYLIALAAKVGGVGYFNKFPYDLFVENDLIAISTFEAAIEAFKNSRLKRLVLLSSGMVFENAVKFPFCETDLQSTSPPDTTYGFQKLAVEYMAKSAWQQYKLPYTIIRPSNVVGIGDNIHSTLNHVIPSLILKILSGQYPVQILGNGNQIRDFISVEDLCEAIFEATFSIKAKNEDFNIGSGTTTSILDLLNLIWLKLKINTPLRYESVEPYNIDLKKSIPDISKAKDLLGFKAKITLDETIDDVIEWIKLEKTKNE